MRATKVFAALVIGILILFSCKHKQEPASNKFNQVLVSPILKITWDANKERDLAGYRIYANNVRVGEVGKDTIFFYYHHSPDHYELSHFTVTAYDSSFNESIPCNPDSFYMGWFSGVIGDFNQDGIFNKIDFNRLDSLISHKRPCDKIFDVNADGTLDSLDVKFFEK